VGRLIKRLTFVRRGAAVAGEEFGLRWRQQVERSGAARPVDDPGLRRLALCPVRTGRRPAAHDGVALEWFDDDAALARWDASGGAASGPVVEAASVSHLLVEERTVFGEPWLDARWTPPGVHRATDPATTNPALLLIGLIEPADGLSRQAFRDYWWDHHRPLANQLVPSHLEPVAYVHNYVRTDEPGRWAGIGEMYERSLETARGRGAWFESEEAQLLVADERRFLVPDTRQLLVTDQYVIKAA
jgi:hypothetical protein